LSAAIVGAPALAENSATLAALLDPLSTTGAGVVHGGQLLDRVALALSYVGIVTEAAIAAAFLCPNGSIGIQAVAMRSRVWLVGIFLCVYVLLPVYGFAWTIIVLTVASLPGDQWGGARLMLVTMAIWIPAAR